MSEETFFSHEAGRHFILNFRIYCSFHHDEAGISKCFCFIWKLWTGWGRYQIQFLDLPTASNNHVGGAIIKFIWQFTVLSFQNLLNSDRKKVKNVVHACKRLKSKMPWGSSKFFYQFIISLCLMREVKIRFICFSVFQFIFESFDWGREQGRI